MSETEDIKQSCIEILWTKPLVRLPIGRFFFGFPVCLALRTEVSVPRKKCKSVVSWKTVNLIVMYNYSAANFRLSWMIWTLLVWWSGFPLTGIKLNAKLSPHLANPNKGKQLKWTNQHPKQNVHPLPRAGKRAPSVCQAREFAHRSQQPNYERNILKLHFFHLMSSHI